MSNYNSLRATIDANVKANGNEEITGNVLNSVLNGMVSVLGAGYQFMGIATPDTDPGTPDPRLFYVASLNGTYTHFDGVQLTNEIAFLLCDENGWRKETMDVPLNIEDLAYVSENGFFVVDQNLYIGFSVDNNGAHAKNILDFEIVE